jgi:hypothetical protein
VCESNASAGEVVAVEQKHAHAQVNHGDYVYLYNKALDRAQRVLQKRYPDEFEVIFTLELKKLGIKHRRPYNSTKTGRVAEAQHGTTSGYRRHHRLGEPACTECKAANAAYVREYYRNKNKQKGNK